MNFLASFPEEEVLLKNAKERVFDLNGHIHTPFSFSAFSSIPQIFELAGQQGIKAIGINDFIVTDGHQPFHDEAVRSSVFPLFNIEFMGLLKEEQKSGIRVNDPNNPGRTYFSGKGLDFPNEPGKETKDLLLSIKEESNKQTTEMIDKLDAFLKSLDLPFGMTFDEVKSLYAEELVRERHIAKALRIKVYDHYETDSERREIFQKIFSGKEVQSSMDNVSALENEIRGRLLKAGGTAFVPEDESAFLEIRKVMDVIIRMGGIPCYPVLLDDKNGGFTEFEADFAKFRDTMNKMQIRCIELIPGRNDLKILKQFVDLLDRDGFVITFGTEHNTPELIPLKVDTRGHIDLDEELKEVSYRGACVIAAHQYRRAKGKEGFVISNGAISYGNVEEFENLGSGVFNHYFSN